MNPENGTARSPLPNGASHGAVIPSTSLIRILIADDHDLFREGLRKLLESQEDLRVVGEARDGEETLQLVAQFEPDILLLDLKMPGTDGIVTLQKLKAAGSRTRVIVLTASEEKEDHAQAVRYGSSGVVLKRTPSELLLKSIRKVHAGEVWLDRATTGSLLRLFASHQEAWPARPAAREGLATSLSPREREVVALVSQGFKNKEMAEKMFISEQTVKNHLHNIFDKLGVSDRLELALFAIHNNLHAS
jgi:DNA-binding NarL/FixJ family response regulator